MTEEVPDTVEELQRIWSIYRAPAGTERKGNKLVRCAYCGKWIKTGTAYYSTMTGPMHQECLEGFDR